MTTPAAILFDLDGTLVDSAPGLAAAANQMRNHRQKVDLPIENYRPYAGAGAAGILGVAFDIDTDFADFELMRDEYLDTYEALLDQPCDVFDGISQVIHYLLQANISWGIVTNKHERFAHKLVPHIKALATHQTLICGDTTEHSKPHPLPLLKAAEILQVTAEECWYIGDDLRDMQAAKAAGMTAIAALWGYLGDTSVGDWPCDHVAHQPKDILSLLSSADNHSTP